jgi:hypothetical protein
MSHKDSKVRSDYYKQWYQENRSDEIKRARSNQNYLRQFIQTKKDVPCKDCGIKYPYYIMAFDHVRGKKLGNLSRMHVMFGKVQILKEIAKCDVVCANCHAARTWKRLKGRLKDWTEI